jgi:hypothetical protein
MDDLIYNINIGSKYREFRMIFQFDNLLHQKAFEDLFKEKWELRKQELIDSGEFKKVSNLVSIYISTKNPINKYLK